MKDFISWIQCKIIVNNKDKTPYFKERQIWWCSLGVNVGHEVDGKNGSSKSKQLFTRPVLIVKKFSHNTFLAVPMTSKEKSGTWYHPIEFKNNKSNLVLSQIRTIDSRRLQRKLGQLNENDFDKVNKKLKKFLFGKK